MLSRVVLLIVVIIFSNGANAMFWPFKKYEVEMSPDVHGVITNGETPIKDQVVYRELFYHGYKNAKTISDQVKTNSNGEFSFSKFIVKSNAPGGMFSGNYHVNQRIYLIIDGQEKMLWQASPSPQGMSTLRELLLNLNCDLSLGEKLVHTVDLRGEGGHRTFTVDSDCIWNNPKVDTYRYDKESSTHILINK